MNAKHLDLRFDPETGAIWIVKAAPHCPVYRVKNVTHRIWSIFATDLLHQPLTACIEQEITLVEGDGKEWRARFTMEKLSDPAWPVVDQSQPSEAAQ